MEVRARVVIQEKGLYTISYNGSENIAEVSGKFRYDARKKEFQFLNQRKKIRKQKVQ